MIRIEILPKDYVFQGEVRKVEKENLYSKNGHQLTAYIHCDICDIVYDLNEYDLEVGSREDYYNNCAMIYYTEAGRSHAK
jgi:hypothetical protein